MTASNHNVVGYWASQEQYSMQDLLKFVNEAERGGFNTCLTSDHFHPWWHDNGHGNFTWVWMAAAAERTKNMQFITGAAASNIIIMDAAESRGVKAFTFFEFLKIGALVTPANIVIYYLCIVVFGL